MKMPADCQLRKSNDFFRIINWHGNNGMDILPLQIFILKRIAQAHLLNIRYLDIFSLLKNVIPVLTDLRRKILEIVDLRWHSRRRPFICIIIPAISVLLKIYVLSPFSTFPRYSRIIRIVSSGDSTESASFNASLTKDSISCTSGSSCPVNAPR